MFKQRITQMKKVEYTVFKRFESFQHCPYCGGTGEDRHTFRNRVFVNKCKKCGGTGNIVYVISEEIPLKEALEELKKQD